MTAATPHPDAALLALGVELASAHAAEKATYARLRHDNSRAADAERDRVWGTCSILTERIEGLPAHTVDGLAVKARGICWARDFDEIDHGDVDNTTDLRLALQIVNWFIRQQGSVAHG